MVRNSTQSAVVGPRHRYVKTLFAFAGHAGYIRDVAQQVANLIGAEEKQQGKETEKMAWNWSERKQRKLVYRKPSKYAGGMNTPEVNELANEYMRKGLSRNRAYAKARKELNSPFKRFRKKRLRGGAVNPK